MVDTDPRLVGRPSVGSSGSSSRRHVGEGPCRCSAVRGWSREPVCSPPCPRVGRSAPRVAPSAASAPVPTAGRSATAHAGRRAHAALSHSARPTARAARRAARAAARGAVRPARARDPPDPGRTPRRRPPAADRRAGPRLERCAHPGAAPSRCGRARRTPAPGGCSARLRTSTRGAAAAVLTDAPAAAGDPPLRRRHARSVPRPASRWCPSPGRRARSTGGWWPRWRAPGRRPGGPGSRLVLNSGYRTLGQAAADVRRRGAPLRLAAAGPSVGAPAAGVDPRPRSRGGPRDARRGGVAPECTVRRSACAGRTATSRGTSSTGPTGWPPSTGRVRHRSRCRGTPIRSARGRGWPSSSEFAPNRPALGRACRGSGACRAILPECRDGQPCQDRGR